MGPRCGAGHSPSGVICRMSQFSHEGTKSPKHSKVSVSCFRVFVATVVRHDATTHAARVHPLTGKRRDGKGHLSRAIIPRLLHSAVI
jgi:hypothetical protein